VLVVVALVGRVAMTVVHVVHMAVVRNRDVPSVVAVNMLVSFVDLAQCARHAPTLICGYPHMASCACGDLQARAECPACATKGLSLSYR
jgi:hypothetical protein